MNMESRREWPQNRGEDVTPDRQRLSIIFLNILVDGAHKRIERIHAGGRIRRHMNHIATARRWRGQRICCYRSSLLDAALPQTPMSGRRRKLSGRSLLAIKAANEPPENYRHIIYSTLRCADR